ncbi:hypothetical protein JAO76_04550 [Pontibacter sp. BT310]|uniref:DUF4843 domain-containing protein n=1 Tax=Pontibacter populi TaxID=890055 RepID=A0ABS6X9E9_9BACT|nr:MULTISPECIES: hypothetical protein [Pontibacter]MBJ6117446.1 hypothetical protein [Pontibacter sp. BT310]MBR0569871.1 hypothetical protein [Microvirga sp. STS03]MBW3364299.1 hypothetical protein [Pontibacter populi]
MKKLFAAVMLLFVLAATASCDTIDDLLTFYINEEETIVVESNFPIGLVAFAPITVPTNSEETFKNNRTRAELVKDVTLNKLTLSIADTAKSADFDFLETIEIFIKADGLDEVRIAYLEEVPKDVKTLDMKLTNAKLDEYIKKDSYTLRTAAKLRNTVVKDVNVNAAMRFKVTADPI